MSGFANSEKLKNKLQYLKIFRNIIITKFMMMLFYQSLQQGLDKELYCQKSKVFSTW